jgi:Transcription elongation factor, GreA/GreB, C-term
MPQPDDNTHVRIGNKCTIIRDDGREQIYRVVAEDEADPTRGTLSRVSPLARALFGKRVGEGVPDARRHIPAALDWLADGVIIDSRLGTPETTAIVHPPRVHHRHDGRGAEPRHRNAPRTAHRHRPKVLR